MTKGNFGQEGSFRTFTNNKFLRLLLEKLNWKAVGISQNGTMCFKSSDTGANLGMRVRKINKYYP